MGKTFGEMQALVSAYLNRDDLSAYTGDFIVMAQRKIERKNYNCMKASVTGSLTDSNDNFAFPDGYKEAISLRIAESSSESATQYRLRRNNFASMLVLFPFGASEKSRPVQFAANHTSGKFYVRPYPDKTWHYTLDYYRYLAELSNPNDTNWWTLNAWEALLYGALLEAETFLMNDSRLVTWAQLYADALKAIRDAETMEGISGSHIVVNGDCNNEDMIIKVGNYVV